MSKEIFNVLVISWIILAIVIFPILLKVTPPYGRHTKRNWGPVINNRLGWMIMELPSLLIFSYFIITGPVSSSHVIWLLGTLWCAHYIYRSVIFPLRLKTQGKMMPLVIVFSSILFNLVNASLNGYYLGYLSSGYEGSWFSDPRFIIGIIAFFLGVYINQTSDQKLLNLRKGGKTGYFIPDGGLFNLVSCPNFLGEILEWSGFAIIAWNLPAFSFALWTAVNLIPRALDHHRWYHEKFPDYPVNRKAIIPFVV